MKKFFAVLLALVLALSMSTMAFAATTGSITIKNAVNGETYSAYRIFDLESFVPGATEGAAGAYSYKINETWDDFAKSDAAKAYVTVDDQGYVTWIETDGVKADVAEFAKIAIKYATDNKIAAEATAVASSGQAVMSGLELGYYLVDTSVGTICSLTTTALDAEIEEKHDLPAVTKEVEEDSDKKWYDTNDADMGQTVNFKSEITLQKGLKNYVLHDKMSEGLTITADSVVVVDVATTNYTVDYTPKDGCTFHVTFDQTYLDGIAKDTKLTVTYSAVLNEIAVVAGEGNPNETWITYGDVQESTHDKTITYTWMFDVYKYTGTNTPLAGATFQLKDADGNVIKLKVVGAADMSTYMVDKTGSVEEITTDATGKFKIIGLDEGTYSLEETKAPEGYNKLDKDIAVVITSEYNAADGTRSYKVNGADPATIMVENKTGSLLPETGGMGTTIFYVVGLTLMLGAAILLITKKRMAANAK